MRARSSAGVKRASTPRSSAAKKLKARASSKTYAPPPKFVEPCLATLVSAPPDGTNWIHEIKFDGYRIQARIDAGAVLLITRSGLDWTERFGALPSALAKLECENALIDSELVVEDSKGHSSFSALASALKSGRSEHFVMQCFDLLFFNGRDLRSESLTMRKEILRRLIGNQREGSMLRYSDHLAGDGGKMLGEACRLGLEGIISKRSDRPYRSGRNDDWLKSKCTQTDEFVILGYVPSNVSTTAVGALAVGYYEKKTLKYAGRVGTGFSQRTASELMRMLKPLKVDAAASSGTLTGLQRKGVVWVKPELVAQIEYRAWTADKLLRHAAFKGLREDKPTDQIRRPVTRRPPKR